MTKPIPQLASLIGSRICLDVISPIGAIHNGIELIMMSRKDKFGPEFDLIAESSNNAANRIKFPELRLVTLSTIVKSHLRMLCPSHTLWSQSGGGH